MEAFLRNRIGIFFPSGESLGWAFYIHLPFMKKAFIQLHIAVLLAGFTAILGKLIELNEGMLVWYRMLISAITLAVILYFRKELIKISCKNILLFFLELALL